MKHFITTFLLILTLVLPANASIEYLRSYDFEVDSIYYIVNNNGVTVTYPYEKYELYNGDWDFVGYASFYSGDVTIPETVTYENTTYSVTSIGDYAFDGCSGLTSIAIPNSVTSIGYQAFSGCSGLKQLTWNPKNCSTMGDMPTSNIEQVIIGEEVETIPNYFVSDSKITSIDIPNSVTFIGNQAFSGCSGLTSVTIGNSVTSIGNQAFSGCSGLTSINIPNSVTSIGDHAFYYCSGLTSINIPNSVNSIGDYAFYRCSGLTSVTIGNSVTSIGIKAFSGCSGLTSILVDNGNPIYDSRYNSNAIIETASNKLISGCKNTVIPNSITIIGDHAFYYCSSLTSIDIPNSVASIGDDVFSGCSGLTSILVDNGNPKYDSRDNSNAIIQTANNKLITGCKNTVIPNSVTIIGDHAFDGCSGLTSIAIPNSVTSIGNQAFYGCSGLKQLTWNPKNCSTRGNMPTSNIEQVIIGEEVETIPNYFVSDSKITSINIPNSVTSIGHSAFSGCSGLTSIDIPNSVTFIGDKAFSGCDSLAVLNYNAVSCNDFIFDPDSYDDPYSYAHPYSPFYGLSISNINIGNEVKGIPAYFTYEMSSLMTLTIGNSVTYIGDYAFSDCNGLKQLTWNPKNCSTMGYMSKTNIEQVIIGEEVETIPNFFVSDSKITSIDIPNSVTFIGNQAFSGCSGLTSINIPNSVTSIGDYAFSGCSGLTSVTIGNSVTSIGNNAFNSCNGLKQLTWNPKNCSTMGNMPKTNIEQVIIGEEVETLPDEFVKKSKITNVAIPNPVTNIGNEAFNQCSGLTNISVSSGNTIYDSRDSCNAIINTATNALIVGCKNTIIPNTVISIVSNAFDGCSSLTSINIPNTVTSIGEMAFNNCSALNRVNINSLDSWCNISFASNDSNPCYFAHHLFLNGVEIKELVIPDSVEFIGQYAFYGCSDFTSATIPETVNSIGSSAFYGCSGMTNLTIPNLVSTIDNAAFSGCNRLTDVYCYITDPAQVSVGSNFFYLKDSWRYALRTLHVPVGTRDEYDASAWYNYFGNIVEMANQVLATSIELDKSSVTLTPAETMQLTALILPEDATDTTVIWASSDNLIATVDGNGLVTAVTPGTAVITAVTTDGSNLSASCLVTVTEDLGNYDNYLSIADNEAFHGDTIVIPVKMTNETSIISFQTDIFLPEGLELMQEDGEYMIDASERMTRTHSIMSNDISSGAIRVICYSSNYKPFTGQSGDDLLYLTIKVADDAEGDYTIQLKNTLLTNTDFVDLAAPDVAANVHVKAYLLGDANKSGTVTVTDVVVTAQYVLEFNPQPFVFEAADVNLDDNITVADVSRIAWMVLNPTMNLLLRAPAIWNNGDLMMGSDITLAVGETRRVSILLDNELEYSAFQFDLNLPAGLTAGNFQLTDRAGNHAFDVNTLRYGNIRALCYSPAMTAINGHEGALLTFDVTATGNVMSDIIVDGIELVTTTCQSVKLDAFAIGVNNISAVNEVVTGKVIAKVEYFNLAGQQMTEPANGVTLVVTTYTDGTRTSKKLIR